MKFHQNDIVFHKPSKEKWVVVGVHFDGKTLIPKGYPFPSIAKTEDCELIESRYLTELQSKDTIKALREHGLEAYIDIRSAMFHGVI